jgi:hypothetical protein
MKNNNKKISKNAKRKGALSLDAVPRFYRPGPVIQIAHFAYSFQSSLSEVAAGGGASTALSLSSIYDPEVSGVGSTAQGYALYSQTFTRYRVLKTRVMVTAQATGGGPVIVGYMMGPNTTISSNPATWTTQTNSYGKMLNSNTQGIMLRHDRVVDLAKLYAVTPQQFAIDMDFSGAFGSNPTKNVYLILYARGIGGAIANTVWDVRLVYETELSQPLQSVSS